VQLAVGEQRILPGDVVGAGGLLAAVAPELADARVAALRAAGHDAAIIGRIMDGPSEISLG
jgi:selenide,water dikinase